MPDPVGPDEPEEPIKTGIYYDDDKEHGFRVEKSDIDEEYVDVRYFDNPEGFITVRVTISDFNRAIRRKDVWLEEELP